MDPRDDYLRLLAIARYASRGTSVWEWLHAWQQRLLGLFQARN